MFDRASLMNPILQSQVLIITLCGVMTISSRSEPKTSFRAQFGFDMPDNQPFERACLELVRLSGLPLDAKNYEPRPEQER